MREITMSKDRAPYGHYITMYFDEDLMIDFNCPACEQGNFDQPVTLFELECDECGTAHDPLDFFDNEEYYRLACHTAINGRDITECLRILRACLSERKVERLCKQIAALIDIEFRSSRQVVACINRNYHSEVRASLYPSEASKRYGWFWSAERDSYE